MSIKKQKKLFYLVLALSILVALSAGLSNMDLRLGEPIPWADNAEGETFQHPLFQQFTTYPTPYVKGLIALLLTSALIYTLIMVFMLSKAVSLKNLLQFVLASVALLTGVFILSRISFVPPSVSPGTSIEISTPPPQTFARSPLGTPPSFITWLVSILLISGISFPLIRAILQNNTPQNNQADLIKEAEQAIELLLSGHDFRNVILNCYFDMAHTIQKDQGLSRETYLTVTEFEQQLVAQGYPTKPVQTLTSLFEKVRYGSRGVNPEDEAKAVDSLNAIISYCKESGANHGAG